MADLKLVKTFLESNKFDKFIEGYQICKSYPIDELIFNSDKFYHAELAAHICDKLNLQKEAKNLQEMQSGFLK